MYVPIVISGEPSSGKTLLAEMLKAAFGYAPVNVGDVLRERLRDEFDIVPRRRDQIGETFFRHYSLDDYFEAVERVTRPGVAVDGVRLAEVLPRLREVQPQLLHVHRVRVIGPPRLAEPFANEIDDLARAADLVEQPTPAHFARKNAAEITADLVDSIALRVGARRHDLHLAR